MNLEAILEQQCLKKTLGDELRQWQPRELTSELVAAASPGGTPREVWRSTFQDVHCFNRVLPCVMSRPKLFWVDERFIIRDRILLLAVVTSDAATDLWMMGVMAVDPDTMTMEADVWTRMNPIACLYPDNRAALNHVSEHLHNGRKLVYQRVFAATGINLANSQPQFAVSLPTVKTKVQEVTPDVLKQLSPSTPFLVGSPKHARRKFNL